MSRNFKTKLIERMKSETGSLKKSDKIDKSLGKLTGNKIQIVNIRCEKGCITTDLTDIKSR